MKSTKIIASAAFTAFLFVCLQLSVLGQTASQPKEIKLANIKAEGMSVRWEPAITHAGVTLTVSGPDGKVFRKEFKAGTPPSFALVDNAGARMGEGQYTYELTFAPVLASGVKERLAASREQGTDAGLVEELRRSGQLPSRPQVQSGSFALQNGVLYIGNEVEPTSRRTAVLPRGERSPLAQFAHVRAMLKLPDDVIPDDLIVQGSACVGLDCVSGEVFGFDTIRLKENNTRLQFEDTSATGFPLNNWQIRANSSAGGGASFLGFVDQGAAGNSETGTIVFEVDAGAPANALKVSSNGKVGLRTATPVLDVHANTSDTPAIRLEQNNGGGFTAQTWDMAGNEANFFVRDVTGGSRLPFRIRPGAPTSSVDISASGDVGIGTASPGGKLDVVGAVKLSGNTFINGPSISNSNDGVLLVGGTGLGVRINNQNNSAELMRVTNAGLVGIATSAPTETLSVNGTASKPGGGSWSTFSDERLKNIRGNFNSGLNAVMRLQPLRYEYKRDNALGLKSEGEHIGFGAQAVQKIIPEAVTGNENGYLQINNDPILWTMLNAIKEQQNEIEQLKEQVRQLRVSSHRRRR